MENLGTVEDGQLAQSDINDKIEDIHDGVKTLLAYQREKEQGKKEKEESKKRQTYKDILSKVFNLVKRFHLWQPIILCAVIIIGYRILASRQLTHKQWKCIFIAACLSNEVQFVLEDLPNMTENHYAKEEYHHLKGKPPVHILNKIRPDVNYSIVSKRSDGSTEIFVLSATVDSEEFHGEGRYKTALCKVAEEVVKTKFKLETAGCK